MPSPYKWLILFENRHSSPQRIPCQRGVDDTEEKSLLGPLIAAILSVAGLGQIYNSQIGKGAFFLVI